MRVPPRAEIGREAWDAFCLAHPGAWFLWTSAYLDYQAARGTRELSFGIMDSDRLVAICPLFLEERDGVRSFTMEGHPLPMPLQLYRGSRSQASEMFERAMVAGENIKARCEAFALEHCVGRIATRVNSFSPSCVNDHDPHWSDISWHTQMIDLIRSEAALHAGIRKSYTSLINHVTRTHEIVVDDKGDLLRAFRRLHFGQAGRETRPERTWEIQREWCEAGNGLIVAAMRWNVAVACTYWILYKGCAYYASSASINRSIVHALVWRAILELKARGVQRLEMGWLDYPGDPPGLGLFKSGFGGEAVPVIAVERRFEIGNKF